MVKFYGSVRVPSDASEGQATISVDLNNWLAGAVTPMTSTIEILPKNLLADRQPVSSRIGERLIHSDRDSIVTEVEFSADGMRIVGSTRPTNNIQIWDSITGKQLLLIDTPNVGDGSKFWSVNEEFSKMLTWVRGRSEIERLEMDGRTGFNIAYPESRIQVWDMQNGNLIDEIQADPPSQIMSLIMSPNGKYTLSFERSPGVYFDNDQKRICRLTNVATGEGRLLNEELSSPFAMDEDGQRTAFFVTDKSKRYSTKISVNDLPTSKRISNLELPPGIHIGYSLKFSDDNKHLLAGFHTYSRKNDSKWRSTVICVELLTGETIGRYDFPLDNEVPGLASAQMSDGTVVYTCRRGSPKRMVGLSFPNLDQKWEVDLGDYSGIRQGIVPHGRDWIGVICITKSKAREELSKGTVDWDLFPQDDLKIISKDGRLLESMVLPVGTASLAFSPDGKSAVIGAVGSVYKVDLAQPFKRQ